MSIDITIEPAIQIIKYALAVGESVWIMVTGGVISGTPVTRDEYITNFLKQPIKFNEENQNATWYFLKNVTVHSAQNIEIDYLAINATEISAIGLIHPES